MTSRDDDETWRSIIENYGERATLDEPEPEPEPDAEPAPERGEHAETTTYSVPAPPRPEPEPEEEGYTPPDPPAVPLPQGPRLVAWVGLLGAPVALLVLMAVGATVGSWIVLLLVTAFVGGFVYLVATMSPEPRDPWDDGSRI